MSYRSQSSRRRPVARGRREGAAGVLHRLHDHHRDRLGAEGLDPDLEVLEQQRRELLLGLLLRPVVAVRVADVGDVGDERLERGAQCRDPVDGERAHRRAVVRDRPRDRLPPALRLLAGGVVLARELPRRLHRLRAARAEEDPVQVARRELGDGRGQLDRAGMRVRPVRVEGQLLHLVVRRLADLVAERVADVDREEPGQRVEVPLAVRVLEVAALAADDDRDLVGPPMRVKWSQRCSRLLLEVAHAVRSEASSSKTAT